MSRNQVSVKAGQNPVEVCPVEVRLRIIFPPLIPRRRPLLNNFKLFLVGHTRYHTQTALRKQMYRELFFKVTGPNNGDILHFLAWGSGSDRTSPEERASFPYSSNEDGGTVRDLRGVAGRRRCGRRRQWRALFEGPLTIVTTDRVAQPSDDAPWGFTPRRSKQPHHPHPSLCGSRTGRSGRRGSG